MRIAFASVLFDDTTRIGSHRARALAGELAALGHEVTVFTQDFTDPPAAPMGVNVVRLGVYSSELWPQSGVKGLLRRALVGLAILPTVLPLQLLKLRRALTRSGGSAQARRRLTDLAERRYASVRRVDQLLSTRMWIQDASKHLETQDIPTFDVVFSTFDPLGRLLRDEGLARIWVNDFRDPYDAPVFLWPVRSYLRHYQNSLLEKADRTTTVSQGVEKSLFSSFRGRHSKPEISVLTNGFSARRTATAPTGAAPLRIAYTGALYQQQAAVIRLLLQILVELENEGRQITLHYAGRNEASLVRIAGEEGASHLVISHGSVSHSAALDLQDQSDVLLVASWNFEGQQGVLSGKFLEYLGANRPILALVAGDLPGSEIHEVLQATEAGFCYEEAQGEPGRAALADWLRDAADQRRSGLPLDFNPVTSEVEKFNYRTLAQSLEGIFEDLLAP